MSRFHANLLLLLTSMIWGAGLIAQKSLVGDIGAFGFAGARFLLSLAVILPFVISEARGAAKMTRRDFIDAGLMSFVFAGSVILQQFGVERTSVTNAGFLTGLYVMIIPFMAWIFFRKPPGIMIWVASVMAIIGVWFLQGASFTAMGLGDWLIIACAAGFALQMILLGRIVRRTKRPMALSAIQYAVVATLGLGVGFGAEHLNMAMLYNNLIPIAYAGIISGGIGYTLQAVAQQYTQATDAGVILSSEALFTAIAGAIIFGDRLDMIGMFGCALILGAIIVVEGGMHLLQPKKLPQA